MLPWNHPRLLSELSRDACVVQCHKNELILPNFTWEERVPQCGLLSEGTSVAPEKQCPGNTRRELKMSLVPNCLPGEGNIFTCKMNEKEGPRCARGEME